VASFAFALLFLSQVLRLPLRDWLIVCGIGLLVHGGSSLIFAFYVGRLADEVEQAVARRQQLSETMSRAFVRTQYASHALWLGGGLLFAAISALAVTPTPLGFGYFVVTALIGAAPSIAWCYFTAKDLLFREAKPEPVHYIGQRFPLVLKIIIVFIGSFLVAAAALVALVSSRVSTTLETLAISSSMDRFDAIHQSAVTARGLDATVRAEIRDHLPPGHSVFVVRPDGHVQTEQPDEGPVDPLTPRELEAIRRIRNGDSSTFIADHVLVFRELPDGSVLALSIPSDQYRGIPYQIAFYTAIIGLLTTGVFGGATYFLARDFNRPLRQLMHGAAEMAKGDFEYAPPIFSDDEVGMLSESFGATRQNLRELIGRLRSSGATIAGGTRVISSGMGTLVNRAREQASLTQDSTHSLNRVRNSSESILGAVESVTDVAQDSSSRALELQASTEEIAGSTGDLFQSVEKTSSSVTEMDAAAAEMTSRSQVLTSVGDEVFSFIAEMESTIEELRRSAESTALLSREVRARATAGGDAVDNTLAGINEARRTTLRATEVMTALQKSIGQITQMLQVIEEVTDKTNLLSLNAAIIAAQAGEHGAGFTVVAGEIRELSDRTRVSTKEISAIVKAIQAGAMEAVRAMETGLAAVTDNVNLASEAAHALASIVQSAVASSDMSDSMSKGLEEQATASRHLHEVSTRMSDHIREIHRATAEQARGTRLLAEEAEHVRDIAAHVRNSSDQQSIASRGIATAMEQIASDIRMVRDLLQEQMRETDGIASASQLMLGIAQENEQIATNFTGTAESIARGGDEFEKEVSRFRAGNA
jgi:methyl-accepting chemotaxis protein